MQKKSAQSDLKSCPKEVNRSNQREAGDITGFLWWEERGKSQPE